MIDAVDNVGVGGEEGVSFDFFQCESDGFLTEGAADLLQRVKRMVRCVLNEIYIGETALKTALVQIVCLRRCGHRTSPRSRNILKLRELIRNCGLPEKQHVSE